MVYTTEYASPLGPITLACDGEAIIGLWFNGQRYFGNILPEQDVYKRQRHSSTTPSAVNIPPSASSFAVVFIDNPLLQIEIASVYQKSLLKKSGSIVCLHDVCMKGYAENT